MNDYRPSSFNQEKLFQNAPGEIIRNKVLFNTYMLLAISLIPTVLGALFGMSSGINMTLLSNPGLSAIFFLTGTFSLMFGIEKNKNNSFGVLLLLIFTFFMGIMLSRLLGLIIGLKDGQKLIMMAFGGTATIFGTMAILSSSIKRELSTIQKWFFIGSIVILMVSIANLFLQMTALMLTVSTLAVVIFSAFMLFDLQRIINGGETNYISATLAIYLDIYNVFTNLLVLLGVFNNNKD